MENQPPNFQQIADLFQLSAPKTTGSIRSVKLEGNTAEESSILGKQALNDGDAEGAIKHFKRATEQREEPSEEDALNLAAAYSYADQESLAYLQYKRLLKDEKESGEVRAGLADLLKRQGRNSDAIEMLAEAVRAEPDNPAHLYKLAELYFTTKRRKAALYAIQSAILLKPDEVFYHYFLGDVLLSLDRNAEALESYRAAIELSPGDDFYLIRASIAFWRLGKHKDAVKAVRLASELAPENNIYHGLLEAYLSESGQTAEADLESARADKMDSFDQAQLQRLLAEAGINN